MMTTVIFGIQYIDLQWTNDINQIIFYMIFVCAALVWEFFRLRKMFKRLDDILDQINEIGGA